MDTNQEIEIVKEQTEKAMTVVENLVVDSNDSFGFRITANKAGFLNINISFSSTYNASTASAIQVAIRKNGYEFNSNVLLHTSNGGASSNEVNQDNFSVRLPVQKDDYFVFNAINITGTATVTIFYPVITFEEI